ncbi:primosomal protein n [Fructobacillus pseudoficulneus]|uniref:Replication restart protein PriA n=1 Tax=Fructobacillus pseudoficulneus TaxID=220714 RepID=A0A3F3GTF5_9LACO|nr:primosomal protein N' [Fructobacillus pseudoficulneus]GAP02756.1 primosomal protein n [Fructobacillus pseudoficulneus]SEH39665.1 replication restart DNA helicase PriA [Fructobacillus pseudoficulneus]
MPTTYAQVIVDVPTQQTNRPYTYLVPTELDTAVVPGVRVLVAFGHRSVLGYVLGRDVDLPDDLAADQVKDILAVLDDEPVLTKEMLALSEELAQNNFSYQVSFLALMLPTALKASYRKRLIAGPTLTDLDRATFLDGQEERLVKTKDFSAKEWRAIRQLAATGALTIETVIENQGQIKTELAYEVTDNRELLVTAQENLRASAKSQKRLLDFCLEHLGQTFSKRDWLAQLDLSAAVLNTGVKNGWLTKRQVEVKRRPQAMARGKVEAVKVLNDGQQAAYDAITAAIIAKQNKTFLLEGITGSGKTEVYLQAAQEAIDRGEQVLFLVPEIALTPQMQKRVADRFGDATAVLHSGLSAGERYDEWRRIQAGEVKVVVGARSAVFAPLDRLGLIIVDEEHETSYSQSENPHYSARDVALWRGDFHHAPVVLGSATPSLESRARAQKGVYQLLKLTKRAAAAATLPPVEIVDMRQTVMTKGDTNFSGELLEKLRAHLDRGEQAVLLLNRRGFSSFVMCRDCGYVPKDPNCNLAMTLHMDTKTLKCHYCDYQTAIPQICPSCGSKRIRYYGTGTEKVEAELNKLLPDYPVIRLDQDTTKKKGSMAKALADFGAKKAQILLGTQMVAKGLDFEDVTLVGVLNADTGLGLPDFRASEKTFELLTQVAGRAGRGQQHGEVVIQTFNPDHYALTYAKHHDYEGFYRQEMAIRHAGEFPPYYYTIQIQTSHSDENLVAVQSAKIGAWLKKHLPEDVLMLGPSPQAIAKLKGRYYFQMLLKMKKPHEVDALLRDLVDRSQNAEAGFQLAVRRDPVTFM